MRFILPGLLLLFTSPLFAQEPRTKTRPLFTFEAGDDVSRLGKGNENVSLTLVQDGGVTEGQRCARMVVPRGSDYGVLRFDAAAMKDWRDFDYFAIDVTIEDDAPYQIVLELWDARSKNYATRCTYEGISTRMGKQTLLYPINRARRNGKEGREWNELEPQDKIDLANLSQVKIFTTPRKDRDLVLHIDNLRLMQEDAAKPKLKVPLPTGAIAFNFGSPGSTVPGFTTISATTKFTPNQAGFFETKGLVHAGEGWPDLLAGTFVMADEGQSMTFQATVPDGEYHYWLIGSSIYRHEPKDLRFRLRINDQQIVNDSPSVEEYLGDKYLYRFLNVAYSEKPHALWERYIDRMYPTHVGSVKVKDGKLSVEALNCFVSALVLVPIGGEFRVFESKVRELRIEAFEKTVRPLKQTKPKGEGSFAVFVPNSFQVIRPWTAPDKGDKLELAAAMGQKIVSRVAIVPFDDLDDCIIDISDLKMGDTILKSGAVRTYWQEYRHDGDQISETALIPGRTRSIEKGITQCLWLWIDVPKVLPAGKYTGTFTFTTRNKGTKQLPITLEVYPFELENALPLSLGMYYSPRSAQGLPIVKRNALIKDQLTLMREMGFTATNVGQPTVTGIDANGVRLGYDDTMTKLAKEVGMGSHPKQYQMGGTLGIGRAIGRRLPGSQGPTVDRNPGIELRQPEFRKLFMSGLVQYREIIAKNELPVAVEIVDEPREVPNPWNRNLADTITYADMVREAKLTGFITPMGDNGGGKDYTILADHADITSVHAYKASNGLMTRTRKNQKTLWLYNTGMDRFSWGFYNWKVGSEGRWEWHFCWLEDGAKGGYPGREWFNPFTAMHGATSYAPLKYPGGMLFTSRFLDVCEGINDMTYIYTLERRITQSKDAVWVKEAKSLLEEIRKSIPEFPEAKGLTDDGSGALIGQGLEDEARFKAPEWRQKIAKLLSKVNQE